MATRSVAQRKRKRDSTSQSVDWLNNIEPADRVSHSSPARPRRPLRRQTARKTQIPQSDEILGSPQSPEESGTAVSKRIPQSEPITPRRSKRLQDHPASESTPSRKGVIVQVDRSASRKLTSDYVSGSDNHSDYESGRDSDESEESMKNPTPRSAIAGNSHQPNGQDENMRRGSFNGASSGSRQAAVDGESSGENSDESSDKSESSIERTSPKTQPPHISESSNKKGTNHEDIVAGLPIRDKPYLSGGVGEDNGSDDSSEASFQNNLHEPEGAPNLPDEYIQDNSEEDDPTHVELFPEDDGDDDGERHTKDFSPSEQLQHEQEMNVNSEEVAKYTAIPDYEQETNMNSQEVTEDATVPDHEQETNVNSQDVARDMIMFNYEQEANVNSDGVAEEAAEETEYSPSDEGSASAGSSDASALFRYTPEGTEEASSPAASPEPRPRPQNDRRQKHEVGKSRQQRTLSVSPSMQKRTDSPGEQTTSFESARSTETPIDEGNVWFAKAKLLGGQKKNWEVLISEARAAAEVITSSRDHYFQEIEASMISLQEEYTTVVDSLRKQCLPAPGTQKKCERLRRDIGDRGNQLRDRIYYRAAKRGEESRLLSGKLAEEFEARIYYPMVMIIVACFEAYCHKDMRQLFPRAHGHLLQAMKLLHNFCNRSHAQEVTGRVSFRSRGGGLKRILDKLIKALQDGALRDRGSADASGSKNIRRRRRQQQQPSTTQQAAGAESTPSPELTTRTRVRSPSTESVSSLDQREWTEDEGIALVQGLKRYQGPGRYDQILGRFSSKLRGRTVRELRAQAQQLQAAWASHIEETVRTQEQRQQWQWLSEV
ncbi:hypothetical protein P170DRAFT_505966 [Aspergillus steynii IBT 23096]|uniref:Uncharacterized protein n=1 Tax=Aspergillus steynii IBT 23096 TaxID=1392250 RepID=A0A2I2GR87_9EURO|nr:uncharacterized protein P170DRAFT_505966 [Aspergillus steynii IBT 23096]PLB55364.1 hypothetical protein P170DRAFT_505966 [Aspergillus steynii IBT 23096]